MSDVYFNVSMMIIEEIAFQINSFTYIFLGKVQVFLAESKEGEGRCHFLFQKYLTKAKNLKIKKLSFF